MKLFFGYKSLGRTPCFEGPALGLMLYCFDISILKNLWTRGPVFSCHTGSHKLYSCSWTSCQATALLPPFKKSVCVCNPWKEIVLEYFPKGSILIFRTYNLLNLPASMFDVLYFILFLIKIFSSPSFRGWRENAWEKNMWMKTIFHYEKLWRLQEWQL